MSQDIMQYDFDLVAIDHDASFAERIKQAAERVIEHIHQDLEIRRFRQDYCKAYYKEYGLPCLLYTSDAADD